MGKRKQLGLIFDYNEGWIGGTYYLLNLVNALNVLQDDVKPFITVISTTKAGYEYIKVETGYPYLAYIKNRSKVTLLQKAVNAFSLRVSKKKLIENRLENNFDLVFPNPSADFYADIDIDKKVYWIFDFQEAHLPEFFSIDDIVGRKQQQIELAYKAKKMVFSSYDALNDFQTMYPFSKLKPFIVQFSVTHPDISKIDFNDIKKKFGIEAPYFYCPNQYWVHKNHTVIIKALDLLVKEGKNILVLSSGKENDWRQPEYAKNLRSTIKEKGLEANFKFLGFLERKEQLSIMQHSLAVVQPSLFEGWSTVVEDSKAMNKYMILSDLRVHREQFKNNPNAAFFDPVKESSLKLQIERVLTEKIEIEERDYNKNIQIHANAFMEVFK